MAATTGPITHQEYRELRYFPALDGLRAISVLLVVTVHMHDRVWDWLAGGMGVTVFFVLSGYLITTLALREERQRGRLSLGAFYARRCFRIFPLYYVVLAIYAVIILGLGIGAEKSAALRAAMPYYLLYLQELPYFYGVHGAGSDLPFYQSWSLGIEEKFYLVWPFVAFAWWVGRPRARSWGTPLCVVAFASAPLLGPVGACLQPYYPILVGCWLAVLLEREDTFDRLRALGSRRVAWGVVLAFAAVHSAVPLPTVVGRAAEIVYPLATALVIASVTVGRHRLASVLGKRPFALLGRLSYAIYLVHVLCLNLAERVFRPGTGSLPVSAAALAAAIALSIAVAAVLHVTVEKPLIRVGRAVSRRLGRRPAEARLIGSAGT